MIDDIDPDHIGWLLFQANQDWTLEFVDRMQAAGHGWFTGARSTLMGHIAPRGTKQGLLVDRMVNEQEIVVKALEGEVKKVDCIAGASIMGDGSVSLILDAVALIDFAMKREARNKA